MRTMTVAVSAPIAPMITAVSFPLIFPGPLDMRGGLARHPLIAAFSCAESTIVTLITSTEVCVSLVVFASSSNLSKIRIVVVSSGGGMVVAFYRFLYGSQRLTVCT